MQQLEQLYNCARDHLEKGGHDWCGFAGRFRQIFSAHMLVYHIENDEKGWVDESIVKLATSDGPTVEAFVQGGYHRQVQYLEKDLPSLEPVRRSDLMQDHLFVELDVVKDFYLKVGMFYLMIVPAILSGNRSLNLVVWRDREAGDFDEREKLRLGLFMRYLLKIIDPDTVGRDGVDSDLDAFGRRYGLTRSETEILDRLLQGHSLRRIATDTTRSYGTVRWHVRNLLEKCHVPDQKNLLRQFYALIRS